MVNLIKYKSKAKGIFPGGAQVEVKPHETELDNSELEPVEPQHVDTEIVITPKTTTSRRSDLQDYSLTRDRHKKLSNQSQKIQSQRHLRKFFKAKRKTKG